MFPASDYHVALPVARCLLIVTAIIGTANVWADEVQKHQSLPLGLCAIDVSEDGRRIFVGGSLDDTICVIDAETRSQNKVSFSGKGVAALKQLPEENSLLLAITDPPSLLGINLKEPGAPKPVQLPIPGRPSHIAISETNVACVTMTWKHAVALASIDEAGQLSPILPRIIELSFPPGQVLAVSDDRFLIADAFGGKVALLDLNSDPIVRERELPIHHIGGLCSNAAGTMVYLTHQRLSGVAETSRDDLHWGTLIQNNVSTLSLEKFLDSTVPDNRQLQTRRLGNVGNGAADPAGILVSEDQDLFVAVSGTDQLAILRKGAEQPDFVDAGIRPTDIRRLGRDEIVVLNRLSRTLSIIRETRPWTLQATLGQPAALDTPEALGERAFFSARLSHDQWMSCHSCHVDGHSPDLLADTLGDGRHESPKRIPSLFGVSQTGPWSWTGSKMTLEDQISQTLRTTMHGDDHRTETLGTTDEITKNLVAFMATLDHPEKHVPDDAIMSDVEQGRAMFEQRGCVKCHAPDNSWTSNASWDIGVQDEQGHREFNPPSLQSVVHRRAFFHDGRFQTLNEVLKSHHPGFDQPPSKPEVQSLIKYLTSN